MPNVFISYSRHRGPVARMLAADLQALGHTAWFDQDLTGGQAWWDQILARVRDCAVFLFVLDQGSLDSTACQRECSYAADLGKPILPVLVEDEISTNLLPPMLARIQFVDYRSPDRDSAFRLAKAISAVPTFTPLLDPLPAPPPVPVSYLGSLAERIDETRILTYEDQSTLLVDLKSALRDQKLMKDSRMLLERLRRRHDLLANIAAEIDDVLRPATAVRTVSELSDLVQPKNKDQFKLAPVEYPSQPDSHRGPVVNERVKGAMILGFAGIAVGMLCLAMFALRFGGPIAQYSSVVPWYIFAVGGVGAGAISRRGREMIVGGLVGMAITLVLAYLAPSGYSATQWCWSGVATPSVGALVGAYVAKQKAARGGHT